MKSPIQKPTFKIALCAIIAALAVMLMLITSLIPVGTYALPCFAGALLIAIVIEYGAKWALGVYAVVSVLSFFVAGDKEAVLYFAMLFGYYPVLKAFIEGKSCNNCLLYGDAGTGKSTEITELIQTVIELRAAWYAVPKTVPESEFNEQPEGKGGEKNVQQPANDSSVS